MVNVDAHLSGNTRNSPVLSVPCPWCGVAARRLCRFPTGGPAKELHDERLELYQLYEELKRGMR